MRKSTLRSIQIWIVAALIFLGATQSAAVDGRDFAGFYELNNVVDQGNVVLFNLAVRVFNYSDADVIGASVVLEDPLLLEAYAVFPNVRIDYQGSVLLSGAASVPGWEYDQWRRGGSPRFTIAYEDAAGNVILRLIELVQMPLGGQS